MVNCNPINKGYNMTQSIQNKQYLLFVVNLITRTKENYRKGNIEVLRYFAVV